jgi:Ser/Thr protein kinase RdoA (MazF antagonist)
MQQLTTVHLPDQILRALDIQGSYRVTPLPGNENDNYLVANAQHAIVVKRLHSIYSVADIEIEAMYRMRLANSELPVAKYVALSEEDIVVTINGVNYVATPYIKGTTPAYSQELAIQVAELLARTHKVDSAGLGERATWFRESYVPDSLTGISDQYIAAKHVFANQRTHMPDFWHSDLPYGIVHGDMHNENIIVSDKHKIVSIIDWEETTIQPLLLDVALAARFMCFRKGVCDKKIFQAFLNAYQSTRPLTPLEKEWFAPALKYTALILSVWAHTKVSQRQMDQDTFADLGSRYRLDYVVPKIR